VKLKLDYSSIIRGEFTLSQLNIMLVMQVNCPGCLIYGIPALTELYTEFKDEASFFIMSTAFEDFDINTEENTRLLVEQGHIAGETQKTLARYYNQTRYDVPDHFTVLFDKIIDSAALTSTEMIAAVSKDQQEVYNVPEEKREQFSKILHDHFMTLHKAGYTFAANLLQGTPTFLVFDDNYKILGSWFGHRNMTDMKHFISNQQLKHST